MLESLPPTPETTSRAEDCSTPGFVELPGKSLQQSIPGPSADQGHQAVGGAGVELHWGSTLQEIVAGWFGVLGQVETPGLQAEPLVLDASCLLGPRGG